jgi:uncharacterized protein (DUF305 family)
MLIRTLAAATFMIASTFALTPSYAQHMHQDAGGEALMQANEAMMKAMEAMEPSGDTDRDFATMMIDHHRGAIDMAKAELEHGDDPELRALATKVIADQEKEIAEMEAWLAKQAQ